jgi:hypothetical protein
MMDDAALGVLGVSFLAPRNFTEAERLFIRSLADLCALALARHYAPSSRSPSTGSQPLPTPIGSFDRALAHIFASTLTLAGVSSLGRVDREVAERLHDAIDELDIAIREIRRGAFEMSMSETDERSRTAGRQPVLPDRRTPRGADVARGSEHQRRLCSFDDGRVFAYKRGHDLIRAADHTLWAHESGETLLSARSGRPIARRVGKVYLDAESEKPLYYELAR